MSYDRVYFPRSKFDEYLYAHDIDIEWLANKAERSVRLIQDDRRKGIISKQRAMAYAYILKCDHKELRDEVDMRSKEGKKLASIEMLRD